MLTDVKWGVAAGLDTESSLFFFSYTIAMLFYIWSIVNQQETDSQVCSLDVGY